jgi:aryl carrier-like protein
MRHEIAPIKRFKINLLDDRGLADLVNEMVALCKVYSQTQQLRCRISNALMAVLRPREDGVVDRSCLIDHGLDSTIEESTHFGPDTHLTKEEVEAISFTDYGEDLEKIMKLQEQLKAANTNGEQFALICEYRKDCRKRALEDLMKRNV